MKHGWIHFVLCLLVVGAAGAQVYNYFPPAGITYSHASGMVLGSPSGSAEGSGTLNAQGLYVNGTAVSTSAGTVTGVSVASANGLGGTVSTPTTTPAITLFPTFTGIAYSNGSAFAAAVASNFPTLNQNTTGNAGTATALATAPTTCGSGQAAEGILASGNATGCFATLALVNEAANTGFMGPTSGSAATPTFRAFVANDIPSVLNGGTSVNGVFSGGSVSATGYSSAGTAIQSTLIGQTTSAGGFQVGLGLNGFFNGTYWQTGTDGTSNGAAFIVADYASPTINFYSIPSTGGATQTVSNASLSTYLDASMGSTGSVFGAATGGPEGAGTVNAQGLYINGAAATVLPSQTGNAGKLLQTNGTSTSWVTRPSMSYGLITTSGSGCAIGSAESANLSGCTRNSTGNYTISFTTDYSADPICTGSPSSGSPVVISTDATAPGSVTILTLVSSSGSPADDYGIYLQCMGT
jgi:hypothetical protein